MFEYDRPRQILNILSEYKSISVHSLAEQLYVSDATVRRDLNALEKQGLVRRVFGGVILLETDQTDMPFYGHTTADQSRQEIAIKALELIKNGDVIMLDASGTANALIRHLKRFKNLTIITNSSVTMGSLQELDATIFVTGGHMPRNSQGFIGDYAADMLRNFSADICFLSCGGLGMDGIVSNVAHEEIAIRRLMIRQSRKRVLLCDSAKFGLSTPFTLCHMNDIDVLISDAPFTGEGREKQLL